MMELTGYHMMNLAGVGYAYKYPLGLLILAIVGKIVVSFLVVWLFVWLMARWHLPPFNKKR